MCLGARTLLPRQRRTKQADGSVKIEPLPPCCGGSAWPVYGSISRHKGTLAEWRQAMGMPWMSAKGLALAIPLQYGRFMGGVLAAQLCSRSGVPENLVLEEMLLINEKMSAPKSTATYSAEFVRWLWRCAVVPNRPLPELYKWFQHQYRRANATFVGKANATEEEPAGIMPALPPEYEAASWRPTETTFSALHWRVGGHGSYTKDLCRATGDDMLARLYGRSPPPRFAGSEPPTGENLWAVPASADVPKVMQQLREWCAPSLSEAGTPVSDNTATLVLRSSDAAPCREELVSHFTLLYT